MCNSMFYLLVISFPRIARQGEMKSDKILPDINSLLHGLETIFGKAAKYSGSYLTQFT